MADIINLKQARKSKARKAKDATAEQNRAKFGRTKAEKTLVETEKNKERRDLDGKLRLVPTSEASETPESPEDGA